MLGPFYFSHQNSCNISKFGKDDILGVWPLTGLLEECLQKRVRIGRERHHSHHFEFGPYSN